MIEGKNPFESIESAHEFLTLLSDVIAEAKKEIDADISREATPSRRADALRMAAYHLVNLDHHMIRSRRILNDLRCLRRLLFNERAIMAAATQAALRKRVRAVEVIATPPAAGAAAVPRARAATA